MEKCLSENDKENVKTPVKFEGLRRKMKGSIFYSRGINMKCKENIKITI